MKVLFIRVYLAAFIAVWGTAAVMGFSPAAASLLIQQVG